MLFKFKPGLILSDATIERISSSYTVLMDTRFISIMEVPGKDRPIIDIETSILVRETWTAVVATSDPPEEIEDLGKFFVVGSEFHPLVNDPEFRNADPDVKNMIEKWGKRMYGHFRTLREHDANLNRAHEMIPSNDVFPTSSLEPPASAEMTRKSIVEAYHTASENLRSVLVEAGIINKVGKPLVLRRYKDSEKKVEWPITTVEELKEYVGEIMEEFKIAPNAAFSYDDAGNYTLDEVRTTPMYLDMRGALDNKNDESFVSEEITEDANT